MPVRKSAPVGAPIWIDLASSDVERSQAFYREVFGWDIVTVSDTDEFRYSTTDFDGEALLGVMSQEVEPGWFFFLGADDVVRRSSGSRPCRDTPHPSGSPCWSR